MKRINNFFESHKLANFTDEKCFNRIISWQTVWHILYLSYSNYGKLKCVRAINHVSWKCSVYCAPCVTLTILHVLIRDKEWNVNIFLFVYESFENGILMPSNVSFHMLILYIPLVSIIPNKWIAVTIHEKIRIIILNYNLLVVT